MLRDQMQAHELIQSINGSEVECVNYVFFCFEIIKMNAIKTCFSSPVPLDLRQSQLVRGKTCGLHKRPRTTRCTLINDEASQLATLTKELSSYPDTVSRYSALIRLGARLPRAPSQALTSACRVGGCVSIVHVLAEIRDGRTYLYGSADSDVARGLVALLAIGTVGMTKSEFLALDAATIATVAGLPGAGGASRAAALTRILSHAQSQVRGELVQLPTTARKEDTAVLLSGGVDSAVALRLAKSSGARVRAFYLRIWLAENEAHLGSCPWEADVASARAVCEQAGVELETVGLQEEYRSRVVKYVVAEARAGRTPNPDVMCNSRVKFGAFFEYVGSRFDRVVSGHYARVKQEKDGVKLFTTADRVKDQTYFLAGLKQQQLRRVSFPLGEFTKDEVRNLAHDMNLPNATRPDSQGVCFLGKLKWTEFLRLHLGVEKGEFVCWDSGKVMGYHDGFWFYTLGQRKGIGLGATGPWYVVSKNVARNIVYISRNYWALDMERVEFRVESTSWISGCWPMNIGEQVEFYVKVRHGPNFHEALAMRVCEEGMVVKLKKSDKALAPGQFAVFYRDRECVGCGVIATHFKSPAWESHVEQALLLDPTV